MYDLTCGTHLACDPRFATGRAKGLPSQSLQKDPNMSVAALAITSIMVLALGSPESAVANSNGSVTPPSVVAGKSHVAQEQSVKTQPTSRAKKNTQASSHLERATSPDRDSPVLGLLWLLTGPSRRR